MRAVNASKKTVASTQGRAGEAGGSCQVVKKREMLECQIGNLSFSSVITRVEFKNLSVAKFCYLMPVEKEICLVFAAFIDGLELRVQDNTGSEGVVSVRSKEGFEKFFQLFTRFLYFFLFFCFVHKIAFKIRKPPCGCKTVCFLEGGDRRKREGRKGKGKPNPLHRSHCVLALGSRLRYPKESPFASALSLASLLSPLIEKRKKNKST